MKVRLDPTQHQGMLHVLESIMRRKQGQESRSEALYFELLVKYQRRLLQARAEGKPIAAHTVLVPSEIFYAMDICPMHLESGVNTIAPVLNKYEEIFAAAKSYGLTPEVCSAHRMMAGEYILGWAPPHDMVVWSSQACDNTAKCGELLAHLYGVPCFFVDHPPNFSDKDMDYFAQEIGDLIHNLEGLTGRKMDWNSLRERMRLTQRMIELQREVYELRKLVPTPMHNRTALEMMYISWLYAGEPEGVSYFETVRDEVLELVAQGKGAAPQERFRLISLFVPPMRNMKLMDWMEREHGAMLVADPYGSHWGEFEWDFDQPLLTLARCNFNTPVVRECYGPWGRFVEDAVSDARSHRAEGAVFWAHIGCRQGCATIRPAKEALAQMDIPTLVLDFDILDPTFVSEDEMKERLEGFFEVLEGRKQEAR